MNTREEHLELIVDEKFQKREWHFQRLMWVVWTLTIFVALAGLLWPGPLSNSRVTSDDGSFTVAYERFLHYHNPTDIRIKLNSVNMSNTTSIFIERSLLDRVQIRRIDPEPLKATVSDSGTRYDFSVADAPGELVLHVDFERYGRSLGKISVKDSEVSLSQFVYP